MDWQNQLDDFGKALLEAIGESPWYLPQDHNPITRALREQEDDFLELYGGIVGFNRMALARVATVCQMVVYDAINGPEHDGELQSLRRHWYAWFKGEFAQIVARIFGDYIVNDNNVIEYNDLAWTGRLSKVYAEFVDAGEVTYKDLWVLDASRMMESFYSALFDKCHIIFCLEKDSLVVSFKNACASLGAIGLISGKGKPSKGASERAMREIFGWRGMRGWQNPFSEEFPLYVITLADHDYDGAEVIAPSFAEQFRRYTPWVLEARVGISPEQVVAVGQDAWDNAYAVKVKNAGYIRWAEKRALFMATCVRCGNQWPVVGVNDDVWNAPHVCPECSGDAATLQVGTDTPHGYEVEALQMSDYRRLMVDALLQILPFETIVAKLRDECKADSYDAAQTICNEICNANEAYQRILKESDALLNAKNAFENEVKRFFRDIGDDHVGEWRDEEDDPTVEDYKDHVADASGRVWRPFSTQVRTEKLEELLRDEHQDDMIEFAEAEIEVEDIDDQD